MAAPGTIQRCAAPDCDVTFTVRAYPRGGRERLFHCARCRHRTHNRRRLQRLAATDLSPRPADIEAGLEHRVRILRIRKPGSAGAGDF